jgi:hypothetical protein
MRQYSDHVLGSLARKLSECPFDAPADLQPGMKERCQLNKMKNVYACPNGETRGWSVRFYCGSKIRYFAFFKRDWISACRIADCITHRIGSRRLRTARPVTPEDYNFGSAVQAERDLKNNPVLSGYLDEIVKHLESIGALAGGPPTTDPLTARVEALENQVAVLVQALTCITQKQSVA